MNEIPQDHDDAQAADHLAAQPKEKAKILAWSPKEGYSWNPLKGWPRNELCFCNSGHKAKLCCLPKQPAVLTSKDAAGLLKAMNMGEAGKQAIRAEYQRHRDEWRAQVLAEAKMELARREKMVCQCGHLWGLHANDAEKNSPAKNAEVNWTCAGDGLEKCECSKFRPVQPEPAPAAPETDDPGELEEQP